MKTLLVRILLLHRTRDEGFTLPMVVGLGLIMVLLGSVALVQSSGEQLNALSKESSSNSLAMAELGIARYRELLNNNRVLAVYSLENLDDPTNGRDWTNAWVAAQTCDNVSGSWVDGSWFDIDLNEDAKKADFNGDGDQDDIEKIGSARIVSYIYDSDGDVTDNGEVENFDQDSDLDASGNPKDPAPRGILTVQGRALDGSGQAQVQVTIPIGVNTDDLKTLDPGIWIHQSFESYQTGQLNHGNLGIINFTTGTDPIIPTEQIPEKNLVLYADNNGCNNFDPSAIPNATITQSDGTGIRDPRSFPPLATSASPIPFNGDIDGNDTNEPKWSGSDSELILGKNYNTPEFLVENANFLVTNPWFLPVEDSDGVERFYAEVASPGNLDIDANQNLLADGKAKVVVIVPGNLTITGGAVPGDTVVGNTSDAATSSSLELHVTGDVTINGDYVDINALIISSGNVSIAGGTTVNLKGSIWANNWDNDGTVNVKRQRYNDESYKYYSTTLQRTPKPLTYAPTGWERQEAQ